MGQWLLEFFTPERMTVLGPIVTTALTVWVGRQAGIVKKLQARVAELEAASEADRNRFRDAIWFIRDLLRHSDELWMHIVRHLPDALPKVKRPVIPESLEREI